MDELLAWYDGAEKSEAVGECGSSDEGNGGTGGGGVGGFRDERAVRVRSSLSHKPKSSSSEESSCDVRRGGAVLVLGTGSSSSNSSSHISGSIGDDGGDDEEAVAVLPRCWGLLIVGPETDSLSDDASLPSIRTTSTNRTTRGLVKGDCIRKRNIGGADTSRYPNYYPSLISCLDFETRLFVQNGAWTRQKSQLMH